jgi:hypothetical protein
MVSEPRRRAAGFGTPPTVTKHNQWCQMLYFHTKNHNSGTFWTALEWKMLVYFIAIGYVHFTVIWKILSSLPIFCGQLVYFWPFWYVKTKINLATLSTTAVSTQHNGRFYAAQILSIGISARL